MGVAEIYKVTPKQELIWELGEPVFFAFIGLILKISSLLVVFSFLLGMLITFIKEE